MNKQTVNQLVQQSLEHVFKQFSEEEVLAVYVTGSTLNNLRTETSDVDLYVVLKQSKESLVFGTYKSGQLHGEHDFKYMELYKFVASVCKTNPNMLELFFERPVYCAEEYKDFSEFLYENRNEVVTLNLSRYFSSSYHMLKNNFTKLKNGSGRVMTGNAGKEVMNFYKSYYQAKAVSEGKDLRPYVVLNGELKEELMNLKLVTSFTEEETQSQLVKMEEMMSELEELNKKYKSYPYNEEFKQELVRRV